ncbi:inter-alpha-trypsin inhibitor heavy chain H6 [Lampris incognitus]|uniref:inter-alpha-trypsin inhibitor heavy chain H6 n=1 Tax=Lampris incognitus TaxID=2546036 RepID=UPI0024B4959D|nr:inter-alpha-trypsin inhibitor heavy chain H6 [Lampris incognitus]
MAFKMKCVLMILTFCVQDGLTERYEAHFGAEKVLLQRVKRQKTPAKPVLKLTDYHVKCSVVSRYALTTVQSSVWNQLPITKEAAFELDLPSSAFISNFTITSNGKVYVAQVKERAAARKIYDAAKKQGKTAGLVATKEREIEKFRVAVSVPSGARVSFSLSYEDLLPRRLGRYELSLGLRPGQPVQNLTLDVNISERTGISFIKVLPLRTRRLLSDTVQGDAGAPASTQLEQSAGCARVHYSPTLQQQNKGLNADFIIQYDVELRDLMGDVQVYDGYFVHYFAPRGLPVVPKDVIFVIDVSGSMIGTKIKQTKQAMSTILGDLREGDHFNIITFSDKVHTWKKGRTVRATRQNIRDAKDFVKRIIAEGWTNINAALLSAAQLVNPTPSGSSQASSRARRVPLVIFLTDGEATIGVTAGDTILSNAKKALGSASLFGLAFGDDADFPLLKRLALDNRGMARMVYEEADAALQLKGFYNEVASPLLSDIQLSYLDDQAFDVSCSLFPNYFQGSELVVTGRVKPGVKDLKVSLTAVDSKQHLKVENDVLISKGKGNGNVDLVSCGGKMGGMSSFVHRLWAYFTIKELLLAKLNTTDPVIQRLLADKATNLSLKYNFVTPVTSLVVVKPDADEATQLPTTNPTVTTAKSTSSASTATITTTTKAPTTAATKIASAVAAKKPSSPSNPRSSKTKPNPPSFKPPPPQPPPSHTMNTLQPKKTSPSPTSGKIAAPPSTKKNTTTSSPSSAKTAPAPLAGKIPTSSANSSKTASVQPSGKMSTSLLSSLKTAAPPAPGKISTPQPNTVKTIPPPQQTAKTSTTVMTSTTTSMLSSVRTEPATPTGKPFTPEPGTIKTVQPPVKVTFSTSETENSTMFATDAHQPEITTVLSGLSGLTPPTPAPAPTLEDNNTDSDSDSDIRIATLVSATFAPMPGVTDGPKLWEAAGLLDYDATYDYDFDLSYDNWDDDTPDTRSFEPPSRLSTVRVFSSSVDGDPHFVVQLPKLHQNLCFTLDGRANDVLRLLEDPERGIVVDGHLMGAPSKHGMEDRFRTYFDQLTISSTTGGLGDMMIKLSLAAVIVEGEGRDILPINQQGSVTRQGVRITVDNHRSCWIELAKDVRFLVLFHHYKHPSYLQMAHLGFYIIDGQGLSSLTQGLLGQFQHADMRVTVVKDNPEAGVYRPNKEGVLARGMLRWGSMHLPVTLQDKTLKDTVRKRHLGKCWVVPKADVEKLLGHPYQSFVADRA